MKIYSADNKLIGEFGESKRIPVALDKIPLKMRQAFLAIEDTRFYDHSGIDPIGIVRAAIVAATSASAKQGASTITQQVARNFFLTREKTLKRKIKEVFISLRIEQVLTKDEIFELYLNKIALGHRSYGVAAAATPETPTPNSTVQKANLTYLKSTKSLNSKNGWLILSKFRLNGCK